jgi:hypothetical protein
MMKRVNNSIWAISFVFSRNFVDRPPSAWRQPDWPVRFRDADDGETDHLFKRAMIGSIGAAGVGH